MKDIDRWLEQARVCFDIKAKPPKDVTWVKLSEIPPETRLEGRGMRFNGKFMGYIKSGWNRGLWLTDAPHGSGSVRPWLTPKGIEIQYIKSQIEIGMDIRDSDLKF